MGYLFGVVCDRGAPPEAGGRERNEDSFLLCAAGEARVYADGQEQRKAVEGDGVLLGVFDGMGGHASGHVASSAAARVVAKLYQPGAPQRPARVLLRYLRESHDTLHARTLGPDGKGTMGTTASVGWLLRGQLHWAHVGDSRIYLWRRGTLRQLTEDHTRNAFLARDGRTLEPEGDHLAQSFIYGSRGLGHDAQLRLEHGLDSGAEVLEVGDRILFCSDGVSGVLSAARMGEILGSDLDADGQAQALAQAALDAGGLDNVTAVVVQVDPTPDDELETWDDDGEETVMF